MVIARGCLRDCLRGRCHDRPVSLPCDYPFALHWSARAPSFSGTGARSQHDDLPGNHENPFARTAKPAAHPPTRREEPAAKPMRRPPCRRTGSGCCCNRHRIWGNRRSRLPPRLPSPPPAAPHTIRRAAHQCSQCIRSRLSGSRHCPKIRRSRLFGENLFFSLNDSSPAAALSAMGCNPTADFAEINFLPDRCCVPGMSARM